MNKIYSFDLPASPSHEQFPLAKCRCKHLISKLSSYVCNKSFVMFPTVKNSLSVGVFSCERIAAQFPPLWRKILLRRGQRKVRLSEVRPILITFHLFLVLIGATNIFLGLIHPLLKWLNCVLKQQLHILQSCEALGSAFSLFEKQEQALSAYWHIHPLIFDLPENTILYTETTLKTAFAIRGYFECVCTFFGIFPGSLLYGTAWEKKKKKKDKLQNILPKTTGNRHDLH